MNEHEIDVACVFGTRPEAVKLAPVVAALRRRGLATDVIDTGQHATLCDPVLLSTMQPLTSLGIASDGTLLRFVARARKVLRARWAAQPPRAVLVQGDTMSAFAAAQAAHELDVPIAHVEAGVRSGDEWDPWPEEHIRVSIDGWARWHYPATQHAQWQLMSAQISKMPAVGNTSIDALCATGLTPQPEAEPPTLLVTLHRRELRMRADALDVLQAIATYLGMQNMRAVWPVHPGMTELAVKLRVPRNLDLRPPLSYGEMLVQLAGARGVLTDSGGLVEEATHLGVPTAIFRGANDRPEAVQAGIARVFPPTVDGARLAIETLAQGRIPRKPTQVFGDGRAATRIAEHLARELG